MARLNVWCSSGEVTLVAATAKTVIAVKMPNNIRGAVKGVEIFGKGISATDHPILCQFGRISADGTGTAGTPGLADDDLPETIQLTFKANYTVEPTYSNLGFRAFEVHPQAGIIDQYVTLDREIIIGGGHLLGLQLNYTEGGKVVINLLVEE